MVDQPADDTLRRAYAALQASRSGVTDLPDVTVETIAALAQGTYRGPDRIELLDRVLAHPVTARELGFFRELAGSAPTPAVVKRFPAPWLALAATVLLAVGVVSVWRGFRSGTDEPVRGEEAGFTVVEPGADQPLGAGSRLVWRSAAGAISYRVEVVDEGGSPVFATATTDTSIALPDSVHLTPSRPYQVRVIASLRDGTDAKAPAVTVIAR